MDKDILKRAEKLETIISYCNKAKRFIKEAATKTFFNNSDSLGFYLGCLCEDPIFYASLKQLIDETEKRLQRSFDKL